MIAFGEKIFSLGFYSKNDDASSESSQKLFPLCDVLSDNIVQYMGTGSLATGEDRYNLIFLVSY